MTQTQLFDVSDATDPGFYTDESSPPPVTGLELAAIKRLRARLAELRIEIGAMAMELHEREQDVIQRIESGADVDGEAEVLVRRRQSISWLTVVARELGAETIERIKDKWPTAYWKELQVA